MRPRIPNWLLQNSCKHIVNSLCVAGRRTLLEHLGHLVSKLVGCPVLGTRSLQNAGECSLFLESPLTSRTALQVCTKSFQFRSAEFVVDIAQDVNSVITGVHSVAPRVPMIRIRS